MAPAAITSSPSNGPSHAQPPTPASKPPNKQPPGEKFDGGRYLNGEWFCRCGRRMYLRRVRKKSAHRGKRFYSCNNEGKDNCGFFYFYEDVKHIEDKAAAKCGGIQTKLNFRTIASPQSARPRQARVPSSSAPTRPISSRNNDDEPDELAGPAPGPAPSPAPSHSEPYRIPTPDLGDDVPQRRFPPSMDPHHRDRAQTRSLAMKSSARQRRVWAIPEPAAPALPSDRRDGSPDAFEDANESLDVDDGLSVSSLSSTVQDELFAEADRLCEERNRHGGKVPSVQPTVARTPSPKRCRVEASFGLPTPRLSTPRHTLRIAHEQREAKRAKISAQVDTTSFATTKTTIPVSSPSMNLDDDGPSSPTTPSRVRPKGPPRTFGTSSYPAPVPFPIPGNALVGRHENSASQVQTQQAPQRSPHLFQPVLHSNFRGSNRIEDKLEDKLEEATFAVFSNANNMNPLPPEVANELKKVLGSFTRNMQSLRASRDMLRTLVQQQKLEIHSLRENLKEQREIIKKMREDRHARGVEMQRLAERMSDDLDHD